MAENNIAPRRLHEQVVSALVERIVGGDFRSGAGLPSEAELCATYGVSRSSVREALRVLAEKGLIEVRHGLGTRVNPEERWDFLDAMVLGARRRCGGMSHVIGDLLEALQIVEGEVAALAASRASEAQRLRLEIALDRMRESRGEPEVFAEAAFSFHQVLLEATRNYVLMRMRDPIGELLHYSILTTGSLDGNLERSLQDHSAIYRAICAGDAGAAREAMRIHLEMMSREIAEKNTPVGVA